MPPACASRSSTSTSPTPRACSSIAHASPAGPPPTITTWPSVPDTCDANGRGAVREQRCDARAAVEALTAAHQHARAPAQAVEIDRGDGRRQRVQDLAARHALAEAHDAP